MNDRLLNMQQLSELLGRDRATIYRWIERDVFPAPKKKGGASLWNLQACLDAIAENHLHVRISFRDLSQLATKS